MLGVTKIDLFSPAFKFGHRIELGNILADKEASDYDMYIKCFESLHEQKPVITQANAAAHLEYFDEILQGILKWVEREKLLKSEPKPEEVQAGVRQLSEKLGYSGTVNALARSFHEDPDNILKWSYGKVFAILYSDSEERKYAERLQKIYADKNEAKRRTRTRTGR